jgi:fluoroacetyl-CoA thioesterase
MTPSYPDLAISHPTGAGVVVDKNRRMRPSLTAGIEHEVSYDVVADMAPAHLPRAVLSTPSMIQLIEQTCLVAVQPHLDDGETTVGTHVCVSHAAPAAVGETVTVSCRLTAVQRRRLIFDVEVTGPTQAISTGTHQRAVIDLDRYSAT